MTITQAFRASLLYYSGDPHLDPAAMHWHEDGLLLICDTQVAAAGDYQQLKHLLPAGLEVQTHRGKIIMPGFIDTHIHYPQTDIIASPAPGLLPWLEQYTFPAERRFEDPEHAQQVARFFLDQLLGCGTTTALVYSTVHAASADALFAESERRNTRMITGKVLMDRHCPDFLQDTAESGARDSEALIQRWHGRGRQLYALTPRFAPTSSEQQLALTGELAAAYPDTFIQSHVAENKQECAWARELFPAARSYLDIYDRYGLLRERAVYGHCIWLDQTDRQRMAETGTMASLCPTSNLFLGSGLFDFAAAEQQQLPLGLATDVGGGTSFSMLRTMNELYKVARMGGYYLSASRMFYLATLGAAKALKLDHQIGSFAVGSEADFIIVDPRPTPLMARRAEHLNSVEEQLFLLALLGDERCIWRTYVAATLQHSRDAV